MKINDCNIDIIELQIYLLKLNAASFLMYNDNAFYKLNLIRYCFGIQLYEKKLILVLVTGIIYRYRIISPGKHKRV